ncbi:MAG: hypothetical protein RIS92_846 [Verrucomicrobiota bacterium]|jgi:hypothetical protein
MDLLERDALEGLFRLAVFISGDEARALTLCRRILLQLEPTISIARKQEHRLTVAARGLIGEFLSDGWREEVAEDYLDPLEGERPEFDASWLTILPRRERAVLGVVYALPRAGMVAWMDATGFVESTFLSHVWRGMRALLKRKGVTCPETDEDLVWMGVAGCEGVAARRVRSALRFAGEMEGGREWVEAFEGLRSELRGWVEGVRLPEEPEDELPEVVMEGEVADLAALLEGRRRRENRTLWMLLFLVVGMATGLFFWLRKTDAYREYEEQSLLLARVARGVAAPSIEPVTGNFGEMADWLLLNGLDGAAFSGWDDKTAVVGRRKATASGVEFVILALQRPEGMVLISRRPRGAEVEADPVGTGWHFFRDADWKAAWIASEDRVMTVVWRARPSVDEAWSRVLR